MKHQHCRCRDCRRAKRQGLVLGSQLLKHLGNAAYYVSAYVTHPRFQNGKRYRKDQGADT